MATMLACSACGVTIQPATVARTGGLCMPCFACLPRTLAERRAWLAGEPISGIKYGYNQPVRVICGPDAGARGCIVAVDIQPSADPMYTVDIEGGDPFADLPESALEPAT